MRKFFSNPQKIFRCFKFNKNIESISDLDNIEFVHTDLSLLNTVDTKEKIEEPIQVAVITKNSTPWIKRSIIRFSSILAVVFVYLAFNFLNETIPAQKVIAESIVAEDDLYKEQAIGIEDDIEDNTLFDDSVFDKIVLEDFALYNSITDVENLLVDDITPTEANAVSVEVEDLVTYSLQKGKVALTFDDGPSTQTVQIVDTLKEYGVGGTFFFVGQNVEKYPEHLLYTKLNGYSIASHSINHPDLRNLSTENQRYEVIGSIDLIEEIIEEEVTLFRPPYGAYDKRVMSLMEESNCKIVLWDNDPKDWESRNADSIFQHIQNTNVDGSIILFHETIATLEALPRIIEYLQSLDLEIVNLK